MEPKNEENQCLQATKFNEIHFFPAEKHFSPYKARNSNNQSYCDKRRDFW
jgi:hypothetical protein